MSIVQIDMALSRVAVGHGKIDGTVTIEILGGYGRRLFTGESYALLAKPTLSLVEADVVEATTTGWPT